MKNEEGSAREKDPRRGKYLDGVRGGGGGKRDSIIPVLRLFALLPRSRLFSLTINSSTAALSTRSNSMSKLEAQPECVRRVNTRAHFDGNSSVVHRFGTCTPDNATRCKRERGGGFGTLHIWTLIVHDFYRKQSKNEVTVSKTVERMCI